MAYEGSPCIYVLSIVYFLCGIFLRQYASLLAFDYSKIVDGEVWRLITSHFVFSTRSELIVGLVLLYFLKQFDGTFYKTRQFGAFVVIGHIISVIIQLILVKVLSLENLSLSPGPYSLIFSLMPLYFWVPSPITVKAVASLLFIQLSGFINFSDHRSVIPAISGTIVGILFNMDSRFEIRFLAKIRLPRFIENICEKIGSLFIGESAAAPTPTPASSGVEMTNRGYSNPPNERDDDVTPLYRRVSRDIQQAHANAADGLNSLGGLGYGPPSPAEVNDVLSKLNEMGFRGKTREEVEKALWDASGNTEAAISMLLG
jgi:hypothetical protein